MNFLQLAQALRRETGTSGIGPSAVTDQTGEYARLVEWVRAAHSEIQNMWLDWDFLWAESTITLVADQRDYDLESNCRRAHEDSLILSGEQLDYIEYTQYRREKHIWDNYGTMPPDTFTVLPNGKVRLFGTPPEAGTINYEYFRVGTDLAANLDEPLIPSRYHLAIVYRAQMHWAEFEDAPNEYQLAMNNYQSWLTMLEADQLPSERKNNTRASGTHFVVVPE